MKNGRPLDEDIEAMLRSRPKVRNIFVWRGVSFFTSLASTLNTVTVDAKVRGVTVADLEAESHDYRVEST